MLDYPYVKDVNREIFGYTDTKKSEKLLDDDEYGKYSTEIKNDLHFLLVIHEII
jgi:hypothetical protein